MGTLRKEYWETLWAKGDLALGNKLSLSVPEPNLHAVFRLCYTRKQL